MLEHSAESTLDSDMAAKLEEFKEDCRLRGMSHGSILSYASGIRIFMSFLRQNGKDVYEVDKNVLKSYIDYLQNVRKVGYKTIEYHFTSIAAFYDWLVFEEDLPINPVLLVRKRYLRRYKGGEGLQAGSRKIISASKMAELVNSILPIRDRALVLLLAKTGVRRGEMVRVDVGDVDMEQMSIKLKPTAKRTNRLVFFDEEMRNILLGWLSMRRQYARADSPALFITSSGGRLNKNHVYDIVTMHAERIGLHNSKSDKLEDHFTPHCFRHWFTSQLRRNEMPREHIQELRGDTRSDAIDIYTHIDPEDLRKSYLAHMPKLGVA